MEQSNLKNISILYNINMFLCSDCKERERSWSMVYSSGHCDNKRCENYLPEPILTIPEPILIIPCALIMSVKKTKKLSQTKITKYFSK